mgnify:CR=1 FL=1
MSGRGVMIRFKDLVVLNHAVEDEQPSGEIVEQPSPFDGPEDKKP